ncbi:hypothetical protein DKX38_012120 [Salix brachista]|uniref:Uncharacterized protein n=1 Tax=Salix brachista TaxID=2182728 RepID=A0A5N5LN27_9ROSI|nr:hypothetical protein DKX38_012120 [Salix brachista]
MADTPSNCSPKNHQLSLHSLVHQRPAAGHDVYALYMQQSVGLLRLFYQAPRAWENPSTLPSVAREAPPEPIEVEHNPSTGNSEEDRPGEDESSRKKRRRHEEKKHDRREKHHFLFQWICIQKTVLRCNAASLRRGGHAIARNFSTFSFTHCTRREAFSIPDDEAPLS